jgi:hypothetical protein
MPYALLGPALSLAGLILLYVSVNGLPATAVALFARAGRPAAGEQQPRQPAKSRGQTEPAAKKPAPRPRKQVSPQPETESASRPRKEARPPPPGPAIPGARPQTSPALRYPGLYFALVATLFAGLGSGFAIGRTTSTPPTRASVGAAQATPTAARAAGIAPGFVVTTTPAGDRRDCAAVHGSEYRSGGERAWYLENCYEVEAESITVWTVGTRFCPSGLAFAALAPLERVIEGRVLCAENGFLLPPESLHIAGPFACASGLVPAPRLLQPAGRRIEALELICND